MITVPLAIVLAAGEGSRMGTPKALLPWGGRPLALAHTEAALAAHCAQVRVVVRETVARELPSPPAGARWWISHEAESLGPAGSIVAAAREGLGDGLVVVSPVDLDPDAWRCLPALCAALTNATDAAKPFYKGRRGHPVLLRASVLARYAHGDATPLRDVLRACAERVIEVPVTVAAVLGDFDTREALRDGQELGKVRA